MHFICGDDFNTLPMGWSFLLAAKGGAYRSINAGTSSDKRKQNATLSAKQNA
jgi:hypothetical protein